MTSSNAHGSDSSDGTVTDGEVTGGSSSASGDTRKSYHTRGKVENITNGVENKRRSSDAYIVNNGLVSGGGSSRHTIDGDHEPGSPNSWVYDGGVKVETSGEGGDSSNSGVTLDVPTDSAATGEAPASNWGSTLAFGLLGVVYADSLSDADDGRRVTGVFGADEDRDGYSDAGFGAWGWLQYALDLKYDRSPTQGGDGPTTATCIPRGAA